LELFDVEDDEGNTEDEEAADGVDGVEKIVGN
jgi:hypothetical protein